MLLESADRKKQWIRMTENMKHFWDLNKDNINVLKFFNEE